MENKMAEEFFFISFIGIGGEAIIGKLDSEKIEKWKEKTEEELLYAAMNNNDICHYGGVFINESLEIIFTKGTKEYKFSTDDVCLLENEYSTMGNLEEGYYSIYISEGRVWSSSNIEIDEDSIVDRIPDIELVENGISELDEVELNTQDGYYICNKLTIKEKSYDLEFDDRGLESNLFIIWTNGNYGYQIIYQDSDWQ